VVTNEFFEQQIRDAAWTLWPSVPFQKAEATIADPRLWHPTKSFDCIVERAIVPNIERLYRMLGSPIDAGQFLSFSAKEPSQQRKSIRTGPP
jgi:hypothetical protein